MNSRASIIKKQRLDSIERLLITHIEAHLGRVPANSEVSKNGKRVIDLMHREEHFFWGTQRLFSIRNDKRFEGFKVI